MQINKHLHNTRLVRHQFSYYIKRINCTRCIYIARSCQHKKKTRITKETVPPLHPCRPESHRGPTTVSMIAIIVHCPRRRMNKATSLSAPTPNTEHFAGLTCNVLQYKPKGENTLVFCLSLSLVCSFIICATRRLHALLLGADLLSSFRVHANNPPGRNKG